MDEIVTGSALRRQRKSCQQQEKDIDGHVGIVRVMAKAKKLSSTKIDAALSTLKGWSVKKGKLHREYRFPDFVHAFGFMAASAVAIEAMNHHPEWFNVWNRVVIDLWTHDSDGITQKDVDLAGKLEALAQRMS